MKQRIFAFFLIFLIALLAGCGPKSTTTPAAVTNNAADAELDLATLPALLDPVTVNQIRERADVLLIDVREQAEYNEGHIPGITLIPMGEIPGRLAEIPKDKTVVVTCRSGNRSSQVASYLQQQGFTNIHDMQGGILAWQQAGLPVEQ
jgi:phage shock protein E